MPRLALAQLPDDIAPILVRADPNGLAFEPATDCLFVADDRGRAIIRVSGERQARHAEIPSGGIVARNHLGGLALAPDGTLYAARLGYGRAGAVLRVTPDGAVSELPGLDPLRYRIGVALDPERRALYVTEFLRSRCRPFAGTVVRVELDSGRVTTVCDGFLKPVGIAVVGGALVVADKSLGSVALIRLVGDRALRTVIATGVPRPDAITAAGPDSVFVACNDEESATGMIFEVWLDGRIRFVARGPWEPRGLAYDGADRLFVSARRTGRVVVLRCR